MFISSPPHTHDGLRDRDRLFAAAVSDSAEDFSFLFPGTTPARWNPCEYIDWKATLHGAPKDGMNTIIEAVRRVEAASGLRFRYQGISTFVPTMANETEPGVDITIAWAEHTATDVVVPGMGLGGGWYTSGYGPGGTPGKRIFQGFAAMESTYFRERDAYLSTIDGGSRAAAEKKSLDERLHLTMHEIGHSIGLGHAMGTGQVMSINAGVTEWGRGDLAAISQLGASNACLRSHPDEPEKPVPPSLPGPDLLPTEFPNGIPGAPPSAEPPVVDPPEPPDAEQPVTEPPITEPPITEPPITEPPGVDYGSPAPVVDADPFSDLVGNAHAEAVRKAAGAGITSGFSDGTFRPGLGVTRGHMATFLARALGLDPVGGTQFPDSAGHTHEKWINAVADAGITLGDGKGGFAPNETVSRAQMATFLVRAFSLPPASPGLFSDTKGNAHEKSIDAVGAAGISLGNGRGKYDPAGTVNRGQMATFLTRVLGL